MFAALAERRQRSYFGRNKAVRKSISFLLFLSALGLSVALLNAQSIVANEETENRIASVSSAPIRSPEAKPATLQKYAELPLSFERHGDSEFVARGEGYAMDIRGARATIALPVSGVSSTIEMEFVHGRQVAASPESELPGKVNYMFGNDPRRWRMGLSTYERVAYHELYPGIDVVYHGNQKQLEFDLVLKPGADVKSVRMRFSGPVKPHADPSGSLMLGDLRLIAPTVIQGKRTIAARYKLLASGDVAFGVGGYDRRQPLIIDPTLVYSTQMGGGNNWNRGNAVALDATGNVYIAGITNADDFPIDSPAFAGYDANGDGFISKLNSTGTALIYSTYIGGSGYDSLQGIAVDSTGAVWAVGTSASSDFPLLAPYQSALQGGNDAVVLKLSPSGALAYSTYLGAPGYDSANSVAVDPTGNAYVTGQTGTGFPTTTGVYQPFIAGGGAAFVTKFSSSGSLTWSTFVHGDNFEYANGIAVDEFGNSYISGVSYSTAFPGAPPSGAQPTNHGNGDAFVAKLNFTGSALLYLTFLGGSRYDEADAIAVDPITGVAVVAGRTQSVDLSTSPGAVQSTNAGGQNGFVAKLNAAGSAFVYTTYLGGNRTDWMQGVAMDSAGNAYVTGYTDSNTFPVNSAIQTSMQGNSTALFHSSNTGANWIPFDANIPGAVYDISPDPATGGTIVVSTENGISRTTNGGGTWTQQSDSGYLGLARSPANPAVIYGFNCNAYQSIDGGVTWNYKGTTSPNCTNRIVADSMSASTAYVYGNFGVLKTTDNGTTWNPANNGLPANQNIGKMVAATDGSLYVALRNAIPDQVALGVYKSSDQAGSWASANNGLESNFPLGDLAAGPSNAVYITDFFNLYESTNGGALWSLNGPLPIAFGVGCIANTLGVSGVNPSVVYWAPCYSGWGIAPLAASTNAGASWSPASGLGAATIHQIVGDPLNAAGAYALSNLNSAPFVAKIDSVGKNLLYSTYLGDSGNGYGIATNGTGDAFVTGSTYSKAFPVTPSALQGNSFLNPQTEVFVTRVSDSTASCSFSVSPQQDLAGPFDAAIQYSVVGPSGCEWTASSSQGWASILSGVAGSGTATVYVLLSVNTTGATRSATVTIAGQNVTLSQLPTSCNPSFSTGSSTAPAGGGTLALSVVAPSACAWSVLNNDPNAIAVVSGASGTGNGTVTINVAPNLGPNTRTFHFYIRQANGVSETISQAGTTAPAVVATITSSPSGASIAVVGTGCIPGTYTTPASLTWNANTNCTISFSTPQIIGGLPYTFYSATVNGGPSTTTNPLTVNSGTSPSIINANFLAPCKYSLSPSGQSFAASGGLGSFTVNTAPTCGWTPVPSSVWITILPSGSKGTAKVSYAVAANTGIARNGAISVGGQTYNINQQSLSCTYSIAPSTGAFGAAAGTNRVVVNAPAGCAWTATSNSGWMTVISGASGTGNGAVVIQAAANTGAQRSGTATIAGQTFSATQSAAGATACGAQDVTSQLPPSLGGFTPFFGGVSEAVSITNHTGSFIPGPIYLVTVGEPTHYPYGDPRNTFILAPSPGATTCFSPLGDYLILVAPGGLNPNQTATIPYGLPWNAYPSFSSRVLSGTPSH
jgi:hypothetical protein